MGNKSILKSDSRHIEACADGPGATRCIEVGELGKTQIKIQAACDASDLCIVALNRVGSRGIRVDLSGCGVSGVCNAAAEKQIFRWVQHHAILCNGLANNETIGIGRGNMGDLLHCRNHGSVPGTLWIARIADQVKPVRDAVWHKDTTIARRLGRAVRDR